MRLTTALYVRHWLAKLHPPLHQSPRESQQLLRILEGSFRKRLDEVYPSPSQSQASNAPHVEIPLASPTSSSNAADHLLNTVLNNPLLAKSNDGIRGQAINAVRTFETALREGKATIPFVCRCAMQYLRGIKQGEKIATEEHLAQKLASWVFTTTPEMKEAFFMSSEMLNLAVQVAGVDKEEAVAWDWLRLLYERTFGSEQTIAGVSPAISKWLSTEDLLVSYIMRLSVHRGNLSDMAQQFVQACQYRSASGRAAAAQDDVSEQLVYVPLEHSWKRLAASVIFFRTRHGISEELFDSMVQYGMPGNLVPDLGVPVAQIYHPTKPSAKSLFQHLHRSDSAQRFVSEQAKATKKFRRAVLTTILDGAQLSLNQGQRLEAQFLLEFAHAHYSEFLPSIPQKVAPSLDIQIQNARGEIKAHSYNFAWA